MCPCVCSKYAQDVNHVFQHALTVRYICAHFPVRQFYRVCCSLRQRWPRAQAFALLCCLCCSQSSGEARASASAHPAGVCPTLSIIATGRNDDYGGGNFTGRVQRWMTQFERMVEMTHGQMRCPEPWFEVLLVEWNPQPHTLPWTSLLVPPPCLAVRIISVPNAVHAEGLSRAAGVHGTGSASGADSIAFLEYHAKNVALRRVSACSEFVLLTNPDALLSQEILGWLGTRSFSPLHFVRAKRVGITSDIPPHLHGEALYEFLFHHTEWPRQGQAVPVQEQQKVRFIRQLDLEASGDFLLAPIAALEFIRGGVEGHDNIHHDTRMLCALAASGLRQQVLPFPEYVVYHQQHSRDERLHRSKSAWHRRNGRR